MRRLALRAAWSALLVLLAGPMIASAGTLEAYFPTTYRVSKNGFPLGLAVRRIEAGKHGTQVFTSMAHPTGLAALFVSEKIVERSVEQCTDDHVRPLSYSYHQSGGRHNRQWSLRFDWAAKRVTGSYESIQHKLAPNTQDLLSFQLALMLDLQAGKREFAYPIVDRKEMHDYDFKTVGRETLRTRVGRLKTLKLVHKNLHGEGSFVFWCAENYGYLPVRIERTDADGDKVTMELYSMPGKKAKYQNWDNDTLN